MLEITSVTHRFGGLLALSNVTMNVPDRTIVGLIGPNGAGKTTLINDVSGLSHPTSGMIRFNAIDISHEPAYRISRLGIARTYQNIRLFGEMSVLENLMVSQHGLGRSSVIDAIIFSAKFRSERRVMHQDAMGLLEQFGLSHLVDANAKSLPYGDQRRLEMARALATKPKLILLDEPAAGMNPVETEQLGGQIIRLRELGLSVLIIEHDMSLIRQVCDRVYVLNFGHIIAHGTPDEIRSNPEVIKAYLGDDMDKS